YQPGATPQETESPISKGCRPDSSCANGKYQIVNAEHDQRRRISTMLIGYGETQTAVNGNQPLLCSGIVKSLMSLFLILYGASLSAQTLEITLVDGRNGRPI